MSDPRAPSCIPYVVASPLWTRAPARDADGIPYIDFMMIIPGLKGGDEMVVESCLVKLRNSLEQFENVVAYVDLNVKLSLLWISAKPVPGITRHIVQAVQKNIPEAKVVAGDFNPPRDSSAQNSGWLHFIGTKVSAITRHLRLGSGD